MAVYNRLEWEQQTLLPPGHMGHPALAEDMAMIQEIAHRRLVSPEMERLLLSAHSPACFESLDEDDKLVARLIQREFDKARKLPEEFVARSEKLYAESYAVWVEAKAKSDFSLFAPSLKNIIAVKREEASLAGYKGSPYDALLDDYERGLTTGSLDQTFYRLKAFLVSFLAKIMKQKEANRQAVLKQKEKISYARQLGFIVKVAKDLGYDHSRGFIGLSVHPISVSPHPTDARITVNFREDEMLSALYDAIHEVGHGMYYQNLPLEFCGTPVGEPASYGVDEGSARFWENIIGRSLSFWEYLYPLARESFPGLTDVFSSPDKFYKALNNVEPSLIRMDADEVTYNLHIILRYELERDLIEGKLQVEDAPAAWNHKMKEYLGLDVPDDAHGILQDIHWSGGDLGYFPTYNLGNIYGTQLHAKMWETVDIANLVRKGEFREIRNWMTENVYRHGSRYEPAELIWRATGKPSDLAYFTAYLVHKYASIYNM